MYEVVTHASLEGLHQELQEIANEIMPIGWAHHFQTLTLAYEIRRLRALLDESSHEKPPPAP